MFYMAYWNRVLTLTAVFILTCRVLVVHAQDHYIVTDTTINYQIAGGEVQIGIDRPLTQNPVRTSPMVQVVTGANVAYDTNLYNSSILNMSGGLLGSTPGYGPGVATWDSSTFNQTGGYVNTITATNTSLLNLLGGSSSALLTYANSITNIGGGFHGIIYEQDASIVNLIGTVGATPVASDQTGYNKYLLNGYLADGTLLNGEDLYIANGSAATFTLISSVPETSSLLVALLGCAILDIVVLRRAKVAKRSLRCSFVGRC